MEISNWAPVLAVDPVPDPARAIPSCSRASFCQGPPSPLWRRLPRKGRSITQNQGLLRSERSAIRPIIWAFAITSYSLCVPEGAGNSLGLGIGLPHLSASAPPAASAAGFILVFLKFFEALAIDVPHGVITALPPQCFCPSSQGGAPKFQPVRP